MLDTLSARATHAIEVKRSRFLANAAAVDSSDAAFAFFAEVKNPTARISACAWPPTASTP
jgi:putative IMPACT (imprinted ancient) family translation regulator